MCDLSVCAADEATAVTDPPDRPVSGNDPILILRILSRFGRIDRFFENALSVIAMNYSHPDIRIVQPLVERIAEHLELRADVYWRVGRSRLDRIQQNRELLNKAPILVV